MRTPLSSHWINYLDSRIDVAYRVHLSCPTSTVLIQALINPLIDLQYQFTVKHWMELNAIGSRVYYCKNYISHAPDWNQNPCMVIPIEFGYSTESVVENVYDGFLVQEVKTRSGIRAP